MTTVVGDLLSKFDPRSLRGVILNVGSSSPGYSSIGDAKNIHFGIDNGINGSWMDCGRPWRSNPLISTLIVYNGQLYTGIADVSRPEDACRMFRHAGGTGSFIPEHLADQFQINEVNDLDVCNGKLYAGGIPLGEVYRYEQGTNWSLLRRLVGNPAYSPSDTRSWCRVPCFAEFQGRLFMGTSTCYDRYGPANPPEAGRVYATEAGKNVSYDDDLGSRWRHVVAVRERDRLKLYIDGQTQATSALFDGADCDIGNDQPLGIGLGAQNHFSGALADIRIYTGALKPSEVAELHRAA